MNSIRIRSWLLFYISCQLLGRSRAGRFSTTTATVPPLAFFGRRPVPTGPSASTTEREESKSSILSRRSRKSSSKSAVPSVVSEETLAAEHSGTTSSSTRTLWPWGRKKQQDSTTPSLDRTEERVESSTPPPPLTYADLTPLGKLVAGSIEVGVATGMEYVSGFLGGYVIGTLTDIPRLLTQGIQPAPQSWQSETLQRFGRMHGKSLSWAKTWGGVSAVFGGFRVATKVARNGIEDEWNNVISSMAAGAYFTRKGKFAGFK